MAGKFEQALAGLDPSKRWFLRRIVAAAAFAVPAVSSLALGDLASAQPPRCTTTTTTIDVTTATKTVTEIATITTTTVTTRTVTTTETPG